MILFSLCPRSKIQWTVVFCLFLSGCSLTEIREREFSSIKKGMTKSQVLSAAGSPHWSDRKSGQDRWFYRINPHDRKTERVVYFEHNRVVHKGKRKNILPPQESIEPSKKNTFHHQSYQRKHTPSVSEEELRKQIKKEIKKTHSDKKQQSL